MGNSSVGVALHRPMQLPILFAPSGGGEIEGPKCYLFCTFQLKREVRRREMKYALTLKRASYHFAYTSSFVIMAIPIYRVTSPTTPTYNSQKDSIGIEYFQFQLGMSRYFCSVDIYYQHSDHFLNMNYAIIL